MALRLEPMSEAGFDAFRVVAVAEHAAHHVEAGSWPAKGAFERARAEHARLLPDGTRTAGHHLLDAFDRERRVGMLWYAETSQGGEPEVYLYEIRVELAERGRGYGTAMLRELERRAGELGAVTLRLHVHGNNRGPLALSQPRLRRNERHDGEAASVST